MEQTVVVNMVFRATEFAAKAHAGQYRKGSKIPYLVHPVGVGSILARNGFADEVVVSGLLHDTVEDCDVTFEQIEEVFGKEVAEIVRWVTEPRGLTWEEAKEDYLKRLVDAPEGALLVSAADKLDNLRSIREDLVLMGDAVWKKFSRPKERVHWFQESVLRTLCERLTNPKAAGMLEELKVLTQSLFG